MLEASRDGVLAVAPAATAGAANATTKTTVDAGCSSPHLTPASLKLAAENVDKVRVHKLRCPQRSWFLSASLHIVLVAAADLSNSATKTPKQKTQATSTIVIQVLTSMRLTLLGTTRQPALMIPFMAASSVLTSRLRWRMGCCVYLRGPKAPHRSRMCPSGFRSCMG
jgi:hypothetical protein